MKKQILYPTLASRLFATIIDLTVLTMILNPIMSLIATKLLTLYFPEYFKLSISNKKELKEVFTNINYADVRYLKYFFSMISVQLVCMMTYFVFMAKKFGTTIGKYLMRIKIVDINSFNFPSIPQCIIRFISYPTIIIGILFIAFSKNKQGIHDKIARTLIIKS